MKTKLSYYIVLLMVFISCKSTEPIETSNIRINQLGFYTLQEKIAIWDHDQQVRYKILDESGLIIDSGLTQQSTLSPISQKKRYTIDLNKITEIGRAHV